jgi:flagellar FliJ protein
MATTSALTTLIDLASKESERHAKSLGLALGAVQQAHEKLVLLNQYRDDYADRLQEALKAGMTPMAHRNFRVFIEKLETAVAAQGLEIRNKQMAAERVRSSWQNSEKKRLSFDTLAQREQTLALKQEAKRDQKESDEQATRMSARRQMQ